MKKFRPYIPIMIVGVVFLVLFGFLGFKLFRALGDKKAAVAEREQLDRDLKRYQRADPTPSRGNINIVEENAQKAGEDLTNLVERLVAHNVQTIDIEPAGFNRLLGEYRDRWFGMAYSNKVQVAQEMGYGFESYMAGQLPREEDVPNLLKQLEMIDVILGVLIRNHVAAIEGFRRQQFEGYSEGGEEEAAAGGYPGAIMGLGPMGGGMGPSPIAASGEPLTGPLIREEGAHHMRYPFEITFISRTEGLRGVLNDFVKSPHLISVRSMTVENLGASEQQTGGAGRGFGGMPGAAGMPGAPGGLMPGPGVGMPRGGGALAEGTRVPTYREYRVVMGREYIRTTLRVDVVEFDPPTSGEEEEEPAETPAETLMPGAVPGGPPPVSAESAAPSSNEAPTPGEPAGEGAVEAGPAAAAAAGGPPPETVPAPETEGATAVPAGPPGAAAPPPGGGQ